MPRDLKQLKSGDNYTGFLAVARATIGLTKSNKPYLDLTLFDGETSIAAKLWNYQSDVIPTGIIKVQGSCDTWNGALQLVLQTMRPAIDGEDGLTFNDFKAVCPRSYELLEARLNKLMELITDEDYKSILGTVLGSLPSYFFAPAAMGHHHAYVHGLLEHSIETAVKAYQLASGPGYNVSLLIVGALLHDVGKVLAYDYSGVAIEMTHRGKLLGHIVLGIEILLGLVPIRNEKMDLLLHIIASHHGKGEWGSPVEPSCKEAIIIHHADQLDASLWKVDKSITDAGENAWVRSPVTKFDLFVQTM